VYSQYCDIMYYDLSCYYFYDSSVEAWVIMQFSAYSGSLNF